MAFRYDPPVSLPQRRDQSLLRPPLPQLLPAADGPPERSRPLQVSRLLRLQGLPRLRHRHGRLRAGAGRHLGEEGGGRVLQLLRHG
jgi:hypothetical protein